MSRPWIILMAVATAGLLPAAGGQSPFWQEGRVLALLRGTWSYHTFEDRYTLRFADDHTVVVNGTSRHYDLAGDTLRITGGRGTLNLPFILGEDFVRVKLPNGDDRVYDLQDPGSEETLLDGPFYYYDDPDTTSNAPAVDLVIQFRDARTFVDNTQVPDSSLRTPSTTGPATRGVYRIEGNMIELSFDDTTWDEAKIVSRYADGSVSGIMYQGLIFHKEEPLFVIQPTAPPPPAPPPPPPHPGWPPHDPPPHPRPPVTCPPQIPGATPQHDTSREFGSTRDGSSAPTPAPTGSRKTGDHR